MTRQYEDDVKIDIPRAEVVEVKEYGAVCFLKVKAHARWDITCFQSEAGIAKKLRAGDQVAIKGALSWRKPKKDGEAWTIQLVARDIQVANLAGEKTPVLGAKDEDDDRVPF